MEIVILASVIFLTTVSFAVTKGLTNLINNLEAEVVNKKVRISRKPSIRVAISIAAFIVMLIPSETVAQDCPSTYTTNGTKLRFAWAGGTTKPTGITSVTWINSTTYPGADVNGTDWRTDAAGPTLTGTENGTITFAYSGGTYNCNITNGALPIELMYFKGETINNTTVLKWATASETNNSHFTIERSIDNTNWTVVGVKNGAGNSANILNYDLTDYTPIIGTVYYRLRQDDYNGDYTYSNTIAITANNNLKLEIMGMYVENNTLKVSVSGTPKNETVEIQIVSLLGTVQTVKTVSVNEFNNNQVELDISELKGGVYNITIKSGTDVTSGKFIK